jgi:hypothetical protein
MKIYNNNNKKYRKEEYCDGEDQAKAQRYNEVYWRILN